MTILSKFLKQEQLDHFRFINYKKYLLATTERFLMDYKYNKWACITYYYKDTVQCNMFPILESNLI